MNSLLTTVVVKILLFTGISNQPQELEQKGVDFFKNPVKESTISETLTNLKNFQKITTGEID